MTCDTITLAWNTASRGLVPRQSLLIQQSRNQRLCGWTPRLFVRAGAAVLKIFLDHLHTIAAVAPRRTKRHNAALLFDLAEGQQADTQDIRLPRALS